ncbi:MAG: rod shape-determining protein MreC [Prevotella sp.]|jgi:rod shape-determining protein MreC|nr:rod shape-determining protein MreC [Prevotella sp.]
MQNLLEFLQKYHHWFLFVLLEVISLIMLFQYNSYHNSVWLSTANAAVGSINEGRAEMESYFSLSKMNEGLTTRNFYLERQLAQMRRLYKEATGDTAVVRDEMQFLKQYHLVPAKVVTNELNRPDNLLTINKGSADGIEVGMGVACGQGVVGVTYLVSDHYTVLIPVLNTSSRISCAIRSHNYFGVLRWDGKDAGVAYLEDIPRHARFKRGDWVETNGYSSIFPPGVLVGKIETVYNSADGLSYRVKVRLSTDFGRLRDVVVINDPTVAERARLLQSARDSLKLNVKE